MQDELWDVIVIGGGVAGLSAALMLGRARRRVLVVDAGSPRNRFAAHMHGVLGHEGTPPAELLARGREELARYGVQILEGQAQEITEGDRSVRVLLTDGRPRTARALVVATGVSDDLPDIPGLAERWGTSVLHCPYCHGWEVADQRLGVLTTSPLSLHQVELVRQWSDRVTVFSAGLGHLEPVTEQRLRARGIDIVASPVVEVVGTGDRIEAVRTADGAQISVDAIFTAGALRPHDAFLDGLGLTRTTTPIGSVLAVDPTGKTSSDRIWAAGNVANPTGNVPLSAGAGSLAGAAVNASLVSQDFDDAVAASAHRPDLAPAEFWENHYGSAGQVWSGRPNGALVEAVADLTPGTALDLGCGEGADAIWLARHGWRATGIDISPTAIVRARRAAESAGVPAQRIRFEAADLATFSGPECAYDLVTASFLHAPVELPRAEILRRAATMIAPGGHLLVISHAATPAAAEPTGHEHRFPTVEEELAVLGLDDADWTVRSAGTRPRTATGPSGAVVPDDIVILIQRH